LLQTGFGIFRIGFYFAADWYRYRGARTVVSVSFSVDRIRSG